MTPFEREIQRQPFRPLPTEWRDGILGKAKSSGSPQAPSGWHHWLWPSPLAWAAIAAVWLLFLSIDTIDRELSRRPNAQVVEAAPDGAQQQLDHSDPDSSLLFTWRERDRLLANLN